ncbi:glutactin-like [Teleopsis dalmanni]|uniref:glutactin-like n=1 Tax=Teleopsis dalmanni TaxID=139649 RepID=UPI0018CE97E1|nr:glutactin-like [Teleopsis dalmanni]XP_037952825.1 glutactin-like [Teleopsis dalmanni]
MAKIQLLSVLLVVLVVITIFSAINAQQNQPNKKKKGNQNQLQQQQQVRPRPKPTVTDNGQLPSQNIKKKPSKSKKQKPKIKYVIKNVSNLGSIRGRVLKSQLTGKKITQFVDIPYGRPPVGNLRFKPPVPTEPWDNVLDTYKSHPGCPSLQIINKLKSTKKKNINLEDCLRLTVSTKSSTENAPVMVYIHGDFLYDGSSMEAAPGFLLEENVVLVSVRYRLGPFGFLSTLSDDIPGNVAVQDVILALEWVQKYISSFGGDPQRVTLFGQVGGAALINVLTMSPAVRDGLFHQVIYQSGSALSPAFITDNPLTATQDIAKIAGCKIVNTVDAINKCIRKLNTTALLDAFSAHGDAKSALGIGSYGGVQFVIGGPSGILPEHPGKLLTSKKYKAYPTIGGSVKNAGTFILKDIYVDNFNESIIDDKLDGKGYIQYIITQTNGPDPTLAWQKFARDEIFTPAEINNGMFYTLIPGLVDMCSTIAFKNPVLLSMQANARKLANSTYLYTFDYEGELNRYSTQEDEEGLMPFELGVSLTDDNLYLFPWPGYSHINSNRDLKVAKRMIALWTSFAATGVPKALGMPEWPAMTDETGPYLKIDRTVTIGDNYLDEFNVAAKDNQMGYNLVNEEFFDSLVEITTDDQNKETNSEEEGEDDDNDSAEHERGAKIIFTVKKVM